MNKHKLFIKNAYEGKINGSLCQEWKQSIEKHYPEFKETKLELNKWYKSKDHSKMLIYPNDIKKGSLYGYGFDMEGNWIEVQYFKDTPKCLCNDISSNYLTIATDKEVETALENELKKLGFKKDVKFTAVRDTTIEEATSSYKKEEGKVGDYFEFNYKTNTLYNLGYGKFVVFENGVFAKIIETITKQEAEKLLGKTIIL